jgi:pimeloyl-ACP methyl ester carboxylesterase
MVVKRGTSVRAPELAPAAFGEGDAERRTSSHWLEATEAALNAVIGDYLEARGSALATEMCFYHEGVPLSLSAEALEEAAPNVSSRIVILVHGMAQTEACWSFPGNAARSYGSMLRDEFGFSPFYLRYNTGRRIAENGRDLAGLVQKLIDALPATVDEITLIGHSMGGLVIRSACHYADELGLGWIQQARRAFYLGSPHLGSPLERGGQVVTVALGAIDHPVVRLIRAVADVRSAGIKDLGHGRLLDHDPGDPALGGAGPRPPRWLPLRPAMDHYLVAGTLAEREEHFISQLLGDALVRIPSAMARGPRGELPEGNTAVVRGVHHMMLAHCPEVYSRIRGWLGPQAQPRAAATGPSIARADPGRRAHDASRRRVLERVDAYRTLIQDGIDRGTTAIQEVQEELTARPYQLLELVPPLKVPTGIVRSLHFAAIRTTYGAIRLINRLLESIARTCLVPSSDAGSAEHGSRRGVDPSERSSA